VTARTLVVGLVLFTAALLQTSLFPHLALLGFRPDLLLLLTALFALRGGSISGLRIAIAAGLLADLLLSQSAVGLSAIVFVGIGYTIGAAKPYLATESITAPILMALTAGALGTAGYGLLVGILGDTRLRAGVVLQTALIVGLYNMLLAPAADSLVRWVAKSFPMEPATTR
jgi:rod shape-determining protein MreD